MSHSIRACAWALFATCHFSLLGQTDRNLVGRPWPDAPFVSHVQAFHVGDPVRVVVAPEDVAAGTSVDVYLTEDQTAQEWSANNVLVDVRAAGPQGWVAGATLEENVMDLINLDGLPVAMGSRPGKAYDVVLDVNQDGVLNEGDVVDGLVDAGWFLLGNWGEVGPHSVATLEHSVSFWETMRIHHPSDWLGLEAVPLVVISHGWTHEYTYYDDLAHHMASYGYVVMSHRNEVGNGGAAATTTASQTALENIDAFFADVETMGGGVLAGHVDSHRIIHAGHSTGGECISRAHVRLSNGDYVSPHVNADDFVLLQSLAPVAFLEADEASPLDVPYHHIFPAADTDVTGNASDGYVQGMALYERASGPKYATFIHGSGHNDLHDNPGPSLASGPDLIGKEATHDVLKPLFLALSEWHAWGNAAGLDYFLRNRQEFRPLSVGDSVVLSGEMRGALPHITLLDDFQSAPELFASSQGHLVTHVGLVLNEVDMTDTDGSFEFTGENWGNGMCRARNDDTPRCATVAWEADGQWCLEFNAPQAWGDSDALRFRAASLTRHPLNAGDALLFDVALEDIAGETAVLSSSWWGGVTPPYPRSGGGAYTVCLPSGAYTLTVGGSTWPEEQLVTLPGVMTEVGFGSTSFVWEAQNECDTLQVLCYDTYGDGWDSGTFTLENAVGEVVLEGTLSDGYDPDLGAGWQNEFHTLSFPLSTVPLVHPNFNLSAVARACIHVGPSHGSAQGAMALDDVHVTSGNGDVAAVERPTTASSVRVFPNPASGEVHLVRVGAQSPFSATVHSARGQVVWASEEKRLEHRLDTHAWPAGMYVVVTQIGGTVHFEKLLIQH